MHFYDGSGNLDIYSQVSLPGFLPAGRTALKFASEGDLAICNN